MPIPTCWCGRSASALQQVEGALCIAIDPFWSGAPKAWKTAKGRNKDIDALEALSERLRELAEMVQRVRAASRRAGLSLALYDAVAHPVQIDVGRRAPNTQRSFL